MTYYNVITALQAILPDPVPLRRVEQRLRCAVRVVHGYYYYY